MSRRESNVGRVKSSFGTHYVHVEHDKGVIRSVWASSPGKFENTELKAFIEEIMVAITTEIKDVQKRWEGAYAA